MWLFDQLFLGKKTGQKLVMTFGTFDILHAGHQHYLKEAKKHGDFLLTILARDLTVKTVKGEHPTHNEKQRLKNLKKTGWTDRVILGNPLNKHQILIKYRPDVVCLGYDQYTFTQRIEKTLIDAKINAEIVRITPFFPQVHKSSLLRAKQTTATPAQHESIKTTTGQTPTRN